MERAACVVLGCVIMLISACSYANDSIARVGVGGLELLKTDNIQIVSEVLEISTSKIKVKYHFRNTSDKDITTTVAFPMPPYGYNPRFSDRMWYDAPFSSVSDFTINVDGKQIEAKSNSIAEYNGKDITDSLRKIGLTDSQIFKTFGDCHEAEGQTVVCDLPDSQEKEITKLSGLKNKYGDVSGWAARWHIAETAYWEQIFPAGKEIEVTHEYQPLVGKNQSPSIGMDGCPDEGAGQAIEKRIKASKQDGLFQIGSTQEVEYILGTGRNWEGPIKKFHLIIKKDSASQIVSLCFPGKGKKISSREIEFSQSNYSPQDKLIIYFVDVN